jgi:hypothetical protein
MLFLMRPRQSYLPYYLPQAPANLEARNRLARDAYGSTRRVPAPTPAPTRDPVAALKDLAEMKEAGLLTDAEFTEAKARVLANQEL